jgi:hypothetical protein
MRVRPSHLLASAVLSLMALSLVLANAVPVAHPDSEVATILLGSPPADVAVNPITDMVYAVNGHGVVSIINGSSGTVTGTVTVRNGTFSIAVDPRTNLVYVGNSFYNLITVINGTNNNVVTTIQNVDGDQVTVNPNTNTIFTLGSIINGSTDTVIANMSTDCGNAGATTIGVDTLTNMIYATAAFSVASPTPAEFCLTEINGATGAVVNTLMYNQETTAGPLSIDTSTNTVYEGYEGPNGATIYTINGTTDTQTGSFTGQNDSSPAAFDSQRNLLYVTGSSGLDIYNAYTDTLIQSLDINHCNGAVAVNAATDYVYVTDYTDDSICVIQGTLVGSPNTSSSSTSTLDTTSTSSSNPTSSMTSTSASSTSSSSNTVSSQSTESSEIISSSSSSVATNQSIVSISSTSTATSSSSTVNGLTSETATTGSNSATSSAPAMGSLSAASAVALSIISAIVIALGAVVSLRLRQR